MDLCNLYIIGNDQDNFTEKELVSCGNNLSILSLNRYFEIDKNLNFF